MRATVSRQAAKQAALSPRAGAGRQRGIQARQSPRQAQPGWVCAASRTCNAACTMQRRAQTSARWQLLFRRSSVKQRLPMPIVSSIAVHIAVWYQRCRFSCASAGVGAYRTEELQPYVLSVVRKASRTLLHRWQADGSVLLAGWWGCCRCGSSGCVAEPCGAFAMRHPLPAQPSSPRHATGCRLRSACWRPTRTRSTCPSVGAAPPCYAGRSWRTCRATPCLVTLGLFAACVATRLLLPTQLQSCSCAARALPA